MMMVCAAWAIPPAYEYGICSARICENHAQRVDRCVSISIGSPDTCSGLMYCSVPTTTPMSVSCSRVLAPVSRATPKSSVWLPSLVDENVRRLQVAMDDALLMRIARRRHACEESPARSRHSVRRFSERPAAHEHHDEVGCRRRFRPRRCGDSRMESSERLASRAKRHRVVRRNPMDHP
jgi:hypothetical protein